MNLSLICVFFNIEYADPMRSQALGLSSTLKQNGKYKDFGFCPSCNHNEPIGKYFFLKYTKLPYESFRRNYSFLNLEIVENFR